MPLNAAELFARTDAGAGGLLGVVKRRLKFTLRHAWFRRDITQLEGFFARHGLRSLVEEDPHLLLKGTRPYLWNRLGGEHRFRGQTAHFHWLVGRFGTLQVLQFYAFRQRELGQWRLGERRVSVALVPACGPAREGELELRLFLEGEPVMRVALCVVPGSLVGLPEPGPVLFVGSMQGARESRDAVKQLTGLMERTKPHAILLNALQGLVQAWGLAGMVGVSDAGHVYAGYRSLAKRVGVRYDELWQELGAEKRLAPCFWQLPLQWVPRPESEVESKKRSQLRRRNALRQQVVDACALQGQALAGEPLVQAPTAAPPVALAA